MALVFVFYLPAARARVREPCYTCGTTLTALLQTTHWLMEAEPDERVVWLRRSPLAFASVAEVSDANVEVIEQITSEHASFGLVVDMRRAPARNDPEFEQAMRALREAVEARFQRTALLLATQAGVLQVQRLTREDGSSTFATMSESAAHAFATGSLIDPHPRLSSRPAPSSGERMPPSRRSLPPSRGGVPPSRGGMTR